MNANTRKAECIRGHPLTGANVYVTKRGSRQCRACQRGRRHREAKIRKDARPDRPVLDARAIARLRDAVADGVTMAAVAGRFGLGKSDVARYLEGP